MTIKEIIQILKSGGVGVIPTDTIYGLVGSALEKKAVGRIYRLRKRDLNKPMIILIGRIDDLKIYSIKLTGPQKHQLNQYWPGKVSIILQCKSRKFSYLHRGTKSLAFRLPKPLWLRNLLKKTGPLVAPSANIQGKPPAQTIAQANKYFGSKIDYYLDRGKLTSKPSTLIKISKTRTQILRKGAV